MFLINDANEIHDAENNNNNADEVGDEIEKGDGISKTLARKSRKSRQFSSSRGDLHDFPGSRGSRRVDFDGLVRLVLGLRFCYPVPESNFHCDLRISAKTNRGGSRSDQSV